VVIKASRDILIVNLLYSQEICFVNEDPTIEIEKIALSFSEHFYPKEMIRWFQILKKAKVLEVGKFI
jgi:hypothetical protein